MTGGIERLQRVSTCVIVDKGNTGDPRMTADLPEKVLQSVDKSRRSFLSKLILGSAFAAPSIASFSMSGLAVGEAFANSSNMMFCSNLTILCSNLTPTPCSEIASGMTGLNFSGCNYAGRNFQGFNLSGNCFLGTDFAGANLSHTVLTGAVLAEANLAGANLTGANLAGCSLQCANLPGANLTGANLSPEGNVVADLTGANLAGANLTRANLTNADLSGANLTGANLHGVIWSGTTCPDGTDSDSDVGGTCIGHLG